jgi:signal transduction histidine kinase
VLQRALAGHRVVQSSSGATLAALPLRRTAAAAAVVSFVPRPAAYGASITIFHREVARAALWAVLIAALVGLLAATLIARRLRRIGDAASAIERGDFERPLASRFGDEVGELAQTFDRMRRRLGDAFEQLRAERDRLGRLLEQLHEGVVAVDADLAVRFANTEAHRLLGRGAIADGAPLPASWSGLELDEFAAALFRPDAALAEARVAVEADQTVAVVGVPAAASGLALLVLTDITESERRERAEREFVANASHELRTPVAAIAGAVEALESGAKDSPADRDAFLALISRQTDRLGRLTRALLLLARTQTGQQELEFERVPLRPLLADVVSATPEGDITLDCDGEVVALTHRDMTEQVVLNLLGNALTHSRGSVAVSARREAENVVIEIADNGAGIAPEVRRRMFDRFYSGGRGRRDGFGLGLAIARDAVRALGGTIDVDSSTSGTVARVTLAAASRS